MEIENTFKKVDTQVLTATLSSPSNDNPKNCEILASTDDMRIHFTSTDDYDLRPINTEMSFQSDSSKSHSRNDQRDLKKDDYSEKEPKGENCHENVDRLKSLQSENCVDLSEISKNADKFEPLNKDSIDSSDIPVQTSQSALAFTVDFGDKKEVDSVKYQNLFERYSARHRRNLSTSKVEIKARKPMPLLSPNLAQKQKASNILSEGYFSSDQEDNAKQKAGQLSQKLKELGSKSISKVQSTTKKSDIMSKSHNEQSNQAPVLHSYHDHLKNIQLSCEKLSLGLKHTAKPTSKNYKDSQQKSVIMNDLSQVQTSNFDEEKSNSANYSPEKTYTKNIEYLEINHDYKDKSYVEEISSDLAEKISNINYLTDSYASNNHTSHSTKESSMHVSSVSGVQESNTDDLEKTNLDTFNVSNVDAGSDEAVSEAGTYTIHKDYTDEEKARMDIDKVFSVGILTEEENNEAYVHSFKMSISRDSNTWITEWATQVAEHNSLPPPIGGATGRTPPLSPTKIPSPIHSRSQRMARSHQEQSDSSLDTESYLRVKEGTGSLSNQNALIDSGGESDDDTSNSYNTPLHSSQHTSAQSTLVRRGSLSEALFRRVSINESQKNSRNYLNSDGKQKKEEATLEVLKSPSRILGCLQLGRRSNSLDRKEYASDTTESNTSRKSSLKNYLEDFKHPNSPILNHLRPSTPKLTGSPILAYKELSTKNVNSSSLEKTKNLTKSSPQAKNIGYFTCTENSPYMLRKSNSTTNYHKDILFHRGKELSTTPVNCLQNSPVFQRNTNIQRSSSNASIKNPNLANILTRRSSFNNSDNERISLRGRFAVGSDSSSETGELQPNFSAPPISSGIKLNRAFSIRRARLNCELDATPNTTPEERRRRTQTEMKLNSSRQQNHHRGRTNSVGANNKEVFKKPEPPKSRTPSISRTDTGRFSMRAPKASTHHTPLQRPNQKLNKDHKKSGRSNSTLTSKEVEFQNWKRRKSYDPMKAAAEGKKKMENSKKHHNIEDGSIIRDNSVLRSASFHGTRGAVSMTGEWSDSELNIFQKDDQPPPPCSPQLGSDSDLETSSYLQTTQNVVSAMSARITIHRPPLVDSGGESDEDTSRSLHHSVNRMTHRASDTESSDEHQLVVQSPITNTKYNRAFSLRRARLEPQESKTMSLTASKNKVLPRNIRGKSEPMPSITRTDSGRFSMRLPKTSTTGCKPNSKEMKKPIVQNTKELEMQNWKRRKSYDPMKAAMEGKRKAGLAKRNLNVNTSSSHVLRSQSFHGSVGLGVSDWSDEELIVSADEASIY